MRTGYTVFVTATSLCNADHLGEVCPTDKNNAEPRAAWLDWETEKIANQCEDDSTKKMVADNVGKAQPKT